MKNNLEKTQGLIFSQKVMLKLVGQGLLREEAYELVQRNALKAWEEKTNFKDLLMADEEIKQHLDPQQIKEIFDYDYHLQEIDTIFKRVGIE